MAREFWERFAGKLYVEEFEVDSDALVKGNFAVDVDAAVGEDLTVGGDLAVDGDINFNGSLNGAGLADPYPAAWTRARWSSTLTTVGLGGGGFIQWDNSYQLIHRDPGEPSLNIVPYNLGGIIGIQDGFLTIGGVHGGAKGWWSQNIHCRLTWAGPGPHEVYVGVPFAYSDFSQPNYNQTSIFHTHGSTLDIQYTCTYWMPGGGLSTALPCQVYIPENVTVGWAHMGLVQLTREV